MSYGEGANCRIWEKFKSSSDVLIRYSSTARWFGHAQVRRQIFNKLNTSKSNFLVRPNVGVFGELTKHHLMVVCDKFTLCLCVLPVNLY